MIYSKFPSKCRTCGEKIEQGEKIYWVPGEGAHHPACKAAAKTDLTKKNDAKNHDSTLTKLDKRSRISSSTYSCMLLPLEAPESHAMSRQAKSVTLSEEERRRLARIDERGSDWRERRRARTVLLLDQGLSIDAVVAQQRIHRETVACPQGCLANSKLPGSARSAAQRLLLASYRKPTSRSSARGPRRKPVRPLS